MDANMVLERAKQIATAQGRLASSPAEVTARGRLDLCTASCLAKAILELSDDQELLSRFEDRLLSEDKLSFLPFIFERHGFAPESAREALAENDNLPEEERLPWFSGLTSL